LERGRLLSINSYDSLQISRFPKAFHSAFKFSHESKHFLPFPASKQTTKTTKKVTKATKKTAEAAKNLTPSRTA